ncbi:MAG: sigma-54 dependent transcriptional regulator [Candidatus Sumerlaeaceae bacterium]|nr:sigma-54 dependent transcriptional regulator [Candidatus Sumerlaeaceae bacterium]
MSNPTGMPPLGPDDSQFRHRPRVLVVDDEASMRFLLREVMSREGYLVEEAADGAEAVQKVREGFFELVVLDVKMPGMGGLEALAEIKRVRPATVVVMITAYGSREIALEAVRRGAYDYFTKPFEVHEMRIVVRRALEKQQLLSRLSALEDRLVRRASFDRIIGASPAMREVFDAMEKVIPNDVTVLITGESGTGKELVAQAVHYHSSRKSRAFVSVNCAAIPETLLESELFGHEKGAFTGAVGSKPGRFEAADGGTLFLDEIGDMPLGLQSKMLRVLQEGEVMRVGGRDPIRVNVRVVAATNQNLAEKVEAREFRLDLYYRLNVFPIHLPPLRRRREDIPLLVEHFIGMYNPRLNKQVTGVSPEALSALLDYPWPGNVRELENVIQRAMIIASGTHLTPAELPPGLLAAAARRAPDAEDAAAPLIPAITDDELVGDFSVPLQQRVEQLSEELEKKIIRAALVRANYHRQATADLLGISRKSLHNKMVKYGLFEGRPASTDSET